MKATLGFPVPTAECAFSGAKVVYIGRTAGADATTGPIELFWVGGEGDEARESSREKARESNGDLKAAARASMIGCFSRSPPRWASPSLLSLSLFLSVGAAS